MQLSSSGYLAGITIVNGKKLPAAATGTKFIAVIVMNYDNKIRMQYRPGEDENLSVDNVEDDFFEEDEADERLDESETDENADEGTGDGQIGRGRDDPFQK